MKRIFQKWTAVLLSFAMMAALCCGALAADAQEPAVRSALRESGDAKSVTVMVYMIASDLEASNGLAWQDLQEMMAAEYGDNIQVAVQTMGCRKWSTDALRSDTAQRFTVGSGGILMQDDELGQLDSTDPETLEDFITWCSQGFPADRYILVLWDHGRGPVYGYGYDQYQSMDAALTLDEIQTALRDADVLFDTIGFDACLMGALETGCTLYDYADYLIASEDFESAKGWNYTGWLNALGEDANLSTPELANILLEDYIADCEAENADGVLSLIELGYMKPLYQAWEDFAYANQEALTAFNYSRKTQGTRRSISDWADRTGEGDGYSMNDYFVTDLMGVASTIESEESDALKEALSCAVVKTAATEGDASMTGLSVSLPYGDPDFYGKLKEVFGGCGFDEEYLTYLSAFVTAEGSDHFYQDWDAFDHSWSDWSAYQNAWSQEEWSLWLESYDGAWDERFGWDRYVWMEEAGIYVSAVPTEISGMNAIGTEENDWVYDRRRDLYYYALSDGSIEYYNPVIDAQFFVDGATGSWYVWREEQKDWFQCPDMKY